MEENGGRTQPEPNDDAGECGRRYDRSASRQKLGCWPHRRDARACNGSDVPVWRLGLRRAGCSLVGSRPLDARGFGRGGCGRDGRSVGRLGLGRLRAGRPRDGRSDCRTGHSRLRVAPHATASIRQTSHDQPCSRIVRHGRYKTGALDHPTAGVRSVPSVCSAGYTSLALGPRVGIQRQNRSFSR